MSNASFITFLIVCFVIVLGLLFLVVQQANEMEQTMQQIEHLRELKQQLEGPVYKYEA